jgi:hypothetical protein
MTPGDMFQFILLIVLGALTASGYHMFNTGMYMGGVYPIMLFSYMTMWAFSISWHDGFNYVNMIYWSQLTTLFLLLEFEKGRLRLLNLAHQEWLQRCAHCIRRAVLSYSTGNLLASLRDT